MDPRNWLFDRRILRRNLDTGLLPVDQHEKYLSELEDKGEESETVGILLYDSPEQDEPEEETEDLPEDETADPEEPLGSFHGVLDE